LLERIARALRSLAVFLHDLAHSLTVLADQLLRLVAALDEAVPGWRRWDVPQ
jgi:hypothetical protein